MRGFMNSYQPQLAVSAILNLETGAGPVSPKRELDRASEEQPFQRLLSDQAKRQEALESNKRESAQSRAEAADPEVSANHDDGQGARDSNLQAEQADDTVANAPLSEQRDAEQKDGQQRDAEDSDPAAEQNTEETALTEAELKDLPLDADLEDPAHSEVTGVAADTSPIEESGDVSQAAVALVTGPTPISAPLRGAEGDGTDPLKSYRVNVSGNPLELSESKGKSAIEQFKLDKELGIAGKTEAAGVAGEAKPAVSKQLNNMMIQMVAAQPTRSAEQVMKDVAAKLDASSGRESSLTAISGLPRAAAERGLNGPAGITSPLQAQIKGALGQPQWQGAISERVAFMASQNIKSAEIQLDPPELGPLQVRVTVNQDQASVAFSSHHAQVREALDQTAFRLRDMLQQEGMNQVDVDVSDQSESQSHSQDSNGSSRTFAEGATDTADDEPQLSGVATVSTALVDQFV